MTFAADEPWVYLGLGILDWFVLGLYFVVVLGIGLWSYRKVKDMADYFMGGRRFGKVFMMFFAFGAGTSSEQAITVVAGTWRGGLVGIWWQFLWLWATPFYWIVAPVMRRMRALTTADFFESRYNKSTAALYSIYGIVMSIVFIAAGLYGSGKMINALTGGELDAVAVSADIQVPEVKWNDGIETGTRQLKGYEFAILAMTVMFVLYGMAGGLGAAILTDFIQGILTIIFSFLLLPYVFYQIGGFGTLHEQGPQIKEGMLNLVASPEVALSLGKEPITVFYIFMLSITALAGIVVQPHIMGVCGAGKTEMEGRFGFTFGNFLKRFCTMAWTFIGLACIVWYLGQQSPLLHPDEPAPTAAEFKQLPAEKQKEINNDRQLHADLKVRTSRDYANLPPAERDRLDNVDKKFADELFGKAAYDILPMGLIGLLMASLLAAVMSTSDAQMVVSSGLFTENLYKRFLVRNASSRHYLWVGRFAGLIIVGIALALQATFTDVIDALKVVIKTPAAIGISLWFGIVWRGWTTWGVWGSTLASAATWWFVAFHPETIRDWGLADSFFNHKGEILDAWQMAAYLSTGVVAGIAVSLLTPRVAEEKLDHFYRLIHTPITPGEQPPGPCTLPDNPAPQAKKLFNLKDVEISRPTWVGIGGFVAAWVCVAFIVWLTQYLAKVW